MNISEDSIRRDLRELAQKGLCRRVYGGALSVAANPGPLSERISNQSPVLLPLAKAAAGLVKPGQTLFLDAGSTNRAVALALPIDAQLTVVTNSPSIGEVLLSRPGIEAILVGGRLDAKSGGALGGKTLADIQGIHADLYFMGACALSLETGITVFNYEEAELKRTLVNQSATTAVVLSAVKFDTLAPYRVVSCAEIDYLLIEQNAQVMTRLSDLENLGCQVQTVEQGE
jgi:DeoR/GlpR family transcriptional regulator of sugar metabolism